MYLITSQHCVNPQYVVILCQIRFVTAKGKFGNLCMRVTSCARVAPGCLRPQHRDRDTDVRSPQKRPRQPQQLRALGELAKIWETVTRTRCQMESAFP